MIDLFNYETSILNPGLKILVFVGFLLIAFIYLESRSKFGGNLRSFVDHLFLFSIFVALGSLFRIFGHGDGFGFNSDYSLKWFQSLAYLGGGLCLILAAKKLNNLFKMKGR